MGRWIILHIFGTCRRYKIKGNNDGDHHYSYNYGRTDLPSTEKIHSIILYHLALLLPRFSLLATTSLGVIGVSGLYAVWIQLHTLNALFTSPYGNILIIKLSAALPLVLLGAYHQLTLHRNVVLVASIGREGRRTDVGGNTSSDNGSSGSGEDFLTNTPISQTINDTYPREIDIEFNGR